VRKCLEEYKRTFKGGQKATFQVLKDVTDEFEMEEK
jgi:hypothetical protein